MGYLVLGCFLAIFLVVGFVQEQQQTTQWVYERETATTGRAIEAVRYINTINDYLYDHPERRIQVGESAVPDAQLGMTVSAELRHVIAGERVYVWLPAEPGLMAALRRQTVSSALLGSVENRRLIDGSGRDMGMVVPARIPNGSIVYLN
ncbi:TPA: type IV pilus biogenesis protein PilM [Pseudomonas aeruginosa]|nr:type IV pilus biogenesis protein PilM [Pseudomonas aeruginosa]HDQ4723248.1 type IV pilus biogenesis protein PilM [Pseudomonas aeruginosa]